MKDGHKEQMYNSPNNDYGVKNKYNKNMGGSNTEVSEMKMGPSWNRSQESMQIKGFTPSGVGRFGPESEGLQSDKFSSSGGFDSTVNAGLPNAQKPVY